MPKSHLPPHWNGLQISADRPQTRRDQLVSHFRDAIRRGLAPMGTRLPSSRQLAIELGVCRQTVVSAYERLAMEELVETRIGDGTYVAIEIGPIHLARSNPLPKPSRLSERARRMLELPITPHLRDKRGLLSPGVPALEEFPWALWRKAGEPTAGSDRSDRLDRVEPLGSPVLRKAIAEYLAFSRGLLCEPEEVVVTAGSHNAIDLISRVIFDVDDDVWVEDPGYVAGRGTLIANGANVLPVPVDQDGLSVSDGLEMSPMARAAFITPSHQFPLGVEMSKARRLALLGWAEDQRAWIVENDYGNDFRYEGKPLPTLHRLSRRNGDRVIFVGTFSNALAPGLRLGFIVSPADLIEPIRRARIFSDRQPPEPLQSQLAEFIVRGFLTEHLRKMKSTYQDRRDAIYETLCRHRSCNLDPGELPASGMHLIAKLTRCSDAVVSRKATELDIHVPPLSAFFNEPGNAPQGLVIGFAGTPANRANRASKALCNLIERTANGAPGRQNWSNTTKEIGSNVDV